MSKKDKLLEKLSHNPKDASFGDLQKLLESVGYALGKKRGKGSHSVFFEVWLHKRGFATPKADESHLCPPSFSNHKGAKQ